MQKTRITPIYILLFLAIVGLVLAIFVGWKYSYNSTTIFESVAGLGILIFTVGSLWIISRRAHQSRSVGLVNGDIMVGIGLGILWMIEISINNFIAPPLPERDIIDNVFWAGIAFGILIYAALQAFHMSRIWSGIETGLWSGFASGLLACCMALVVIVFGMPFLLRDPLNLAEWATIRSNAIAPSMSAYFAFETFAGAFLHLIVLGVIMGGLLGVIGGLIGKGFNLGKGFVRTKQEGV